MRLSYCDRIVAIHRINNATGLTTNSFMNKTIHHCDQAKPNEDLSFGMKIVNKHIYIMHKKK